MTLEIWPWLVSGGVLCCIIIITVIVVGIYCRCMRGMYIHTPEANLHSSIDIIMLLGKAKYDVERNQNDNLSSGIDLEHRGSPSQNENRLMSQEENMHNESRSRSQEVLHSTSINSEKIIHGK